MKSYLFREKKSNLFGVLLVIGAGLLCLSKTLDGLVSGLSFDIPFNLRPNIAVKDPILIYMDDVSQEKLREPSLENWNRSRHADLIRILARARARAIAFDVWFAGIKPEDKALLQEIALATNSGTKVLLAGVTLGELGFQHVLGPFRGTNDAIATQEELLRQEAVPWGLVQAGTPDKPHQQYIPKHSVPTLARSLAELTNTNQLAAPAAARWLNYYGPPGQLPWFSYSRVINGEIPDAEFSNKVVFVGANARIGPGTDFFPTPYWMQTREKYPGVDLNATAYLNLASHDSLVRLPDRLEAILVVLAGVMFGLLFNGRHPLSALWLAFGSALLILLTACLLAWKAHWWLSWLPIAGVQVPLAFGWALFSHTRRLAQEKAALEAKLTSTESPTLRESGPKQAVLESFPRVPSIPDHLLLKLVGSGAYGEVWLARNAIGTFHVVKIIRRAGFDSNEPYEREFRGLQRFMPISRSHPGLVQILHVGRNDSAGIIYYIMEAADDEAKGTTIDPETYSPCNLSRKIHACRSLTADEGLQLALPLAAALGHLHKERLIHRDIKPANIIFVASKPKLADIGLVTDVGTDSRHLSFVGTAGYIPPEGPGQPSADVYALGLVLYEAVMGLPRNSFPGLPENALQRPDVGLLLALNEIILKACTPNPAERFATGTELETALRRLLEQTTAPFRAKV